MPSCLVRLKKCQTPLDYHENTLPQANVEVCLSTVKKYLKEMDYDSYSMAHKPLLTSVHKCSRRYWAMEHKDWRVDQWKNMIWADESQFTVMEYNGFGKAIKKERERYQKRYIMSTLKFGKGSVMFWGCFWPGGYGPFGDFERFHRTGSIYQVFKRPFPSLI